MEINWPQIDLISFECLKEGNKYGKVVSNNPQPDILILV